MLWLAVVSQNLWELYTKCFDQFEAGDLKGQTLTSKQLMTKPEVKQTQFQCLLPLSEDIQSQLLSLVLSRELSLKELKKNCEKEKKMSDLKEKFVHITNSKSWSDAEVRFPYHAKPEKLEQFLSLNLKKHTPQAFSQFCAAAVLSGTEEPTGPAEVSELSSCRLIEVEDLNSLDPTIVLTTKFNGASLFIFYIEKVAT